MSADIKPFKIAVPDSAINRLREKLALATYPDEVGFSDSWDYGVPLSDVKRLAKYWQNSFDWRAVEAKLNEFPQFTTTISVDGFDDLEIHFVHQKSADTGSIPLLFCHGWPGSFLEIVKILPLLTQAGGGAGEGGGPSFHIVAPSLPNFGFSQGVSKTGFGIPQYAEVCHKLMLRLGYQQYVTQGGDWGFLITRMIGTLYPSHCLASHVNVIFTASMPSFFRSPLLYLQQLVLPRTAAERAGLARTKWYHEDDSAYFQEQRTRPATLGFSLADSPVGLLAWIYEKLRGWTDAYPWTDDEILTWVSVYQFSAAGPAASVRIYYEHAHAEQARTKKALEYNPRVKLGVSYFPQDLIVLPKAFAHTLGPVVFMAEHKDGGHFAALERPELLAGDLKKMFGSKGGASDITQKFASRR